VDAPMTRSTERTGEHIAMTRPLLSLLVATLLLLSSASNVWADEVPSRADADDGIIVDYTGRLQDERSQPISGIFHLEFKVYDDQQAASAKWQERHYVAVVDGDYTVPLGSQETLERDALPSSAWLGVELVGEGELVRDRLQTGQTPSANKQPTNNDGGSHISDETKKLLEGARDNEKIAFADIAERAMVADQAEVAKRAESIGEFSVEELEEKANLALERLGEHVTDPDAHSATGGLKLGDDRKGMKRVGGAGGTPYEANCPPGYVVTGIKGGAGRLLDSIRLVCQKLR
jgi:hypothetical protein